MALNEAIPRHRGCRDSFVRSMVKGTIRQTLTLDCIIDRLANSGVSSIKIRTLIILRMGLYALREMDSVPDHAAVSEAVSLARKTARGTDRFINAVLRSYIRNRNEYEVSSAEPPFIAEIKDKYKRLSVKYSFPVSLVRRISDQYGDEAESILKGLNTPPPVILRPNTLKTTAEELAAALEDRGISTEVIELSDDAGAGTESAVNHGHDDAGADIKAVAVHGGSIIGSDLYREGMFTVQSLSSMMAVRALCPKRGSTVLDMCAAPGGKTTMMAEMMGNKGRITACDVYGHRLELIEAAAARLGIGIIETRLADGTSADPSMDAQYDYVLCDVPCSGLGVMSTKPEIRLKADEEDEDRSQLPDIQLSILRNALRYARPGGRICYSTCTLDRDENEGVIKRLEAEDHTFGRIVEMRTILPYNNVIGFYYCIIEKSLQ